jgi:hypothetical protein
MSERNPGIPLRGLIAALALSTTTTGALAATATPFEFTFLFRDTVGGVTAFANPGLDPGKPVPGAIVGSLVWGNENGTFEAAGLKGQDAGTDFALAATDWQTGNAFTLNFSVAPGFVLDLDSITFAEQASGGSRGTGPNAWTLFVGNPGSLVDVGSGSGIPSAYTNQSITDASLPDALTGDVAVRLFATGATASTATWRIDNFTVSGSLTAVPVPAAAWLFGSALLGLAGLRRRAG